MVEISSSGSGEGPGEQSPGLLYRRVRKEGGGATTSWVWDGNTLLHELSGQGEPVTWIFDPTGYAPLGRLDGSSRHAVVNDQSGAPSTIHDEAGETAWRGQIDLYGVARPDVARTPYPWRWPGQYEDAETGLYYNRFRYYDPQTGRYISPDPIGFLGGLDPYGYTSDPLTLVDPLGLNAHHTIPRALMDQLVEADLMPRSIFGELNPIGRGTNTPLVDLPRRPVNVHSNVHSELADFLKEKYPDMDMGRGFGRSKWWNSYIKQLSGEDRLGQALEDLRQFYHEKLPTLNVLDDMGEQADDALKGLQDSFDDDARRIQESCS